MLKNKNMRFRLYRRLRVYAVIATTMSFIIRLTATAQGRAFRGGMTNHVANHLSLDKYRKRIAPPFLRTKMRHVTHPLSSHPPIPREAAPKD